MSWQTYVDSYLMAPLAVGGTLQSSAVCGKDGGVWARSPDFPAATTEQLKTIANDFVAKEPSFQQHGLWVGTRKFLVVRFDPEENVLSGKDAPGHGLDGKGQGGICIKMTNSALVIGLYDIKDQAGACNTTVEGVGKYLLDSNY